MGERRNNEITLGPENFQQSVDERQSEARPVTEISELAEPAQIRMNHRRFTPQHARASQSGRNVVEGEGALANAKENRPGVPSRRVAYHVAGL
jgi:hypothetical protein